MASEGMSTAYPPPFGYTFSESLDYPRDSAPTPPPGPEILDHQERRLYEGFFHDVFSGHWDEMSQSPPENFFDVYKDVEGPEYLSAQPPPRFYAAVASLPPLIADPTTTSSQSSQLPNIDPNHIVPSIHDHLPNYITPATIFHPDSRIHQYISSTPELNTSEPSMALHQASAHSPLEPHSLSFSTPAAWSTRYSPPSTLVTSLSVSGNSSHEARYNSLPFVRKPSFEYGSDPQFNRYGFTAPAHQPTERNGTNIIDDLRYSPIGGSVESACEITAIESNGPSSGSLRYLIHGSHGSTASRSPSSQESDDSSLQVTTSRHQEVQIQTSSTVRRAAKGGVAPESSRGRRGRVTKSPFTLDEKRRRHREAEQKRRDKANEPKEDMLALCPGLHEAKVTKSGELEYFQQWLRSLVEDNERMEAYLEKLGR
ncbi:MAG: hypothetical protein Q9218_000341 [Villophora microphyllina]